MPHKMINGAQWILEAPNSISIRKLAFHVDKIYIKTIYIAKGSKYPPKQNIQNGTKSEMVYPGIFSPLRFLI